MPPVSETQPDFTLNTLTFIALVFFASGCFGTVWALRLGYLTLFENWGGSGFVGCVFWTVLSFAGAVYADYVEPVAYPKERAR